MRILHSFKQALTAKFILLATVPLLIFAFFTVRGVTAHLDHEIRTKNLLLARSLAGEVERFLDEPLSLLNQIKTLMEREDLIRPDRIGAYLDLLIDHYDYFNSIQILDPQGTIRYVTPYDPDYIGADMSGHPQYKITAQTGKPAWSPTFISQLSGQPTVTLSIPFENGTIVGYLNLETLNRMTDRIIIDPNGYAVISDQNGVIIAHPDRSFVMERFNVSNLPLVQNAMDGKEGTFRYRFRGVDKLGSVAIVPQTGWLVVFVQPEETAFGPVAKIRRYFRIGILLAAVLAALLSMVSLAKTLRPLTRLMAYAKSIEEGDYEQPLRLKSYTEIDTLSGHLRRMARAVQSRETELKESREALARSKADLETAQKLAKMGSWSYDPPTGILTLSEQMDRIFGRDSASPPTIESFLEKIHPEDQGECRRLFQEAQETGQNCERIFRIGFDDGAYRHIRTLVECLRDENGETIRVFGASQDITEQKQREQEQEALRIRLHQAQKMEAVGTLAGGIAHEFNNLLFPIIGYTEMVMEDLPESSLGHRNLKEVILAAKRARDSVRQLLSFTQNHPGKKQAVRILPIVADVLRMAEKDLPPNIDIARQLSADIPPVVADPGQIHQAAGHICNNGIRAMGKSGGLLTVSLSNAAITPLTPSRDGIPAGNYALLEIRDTGHGMDPSVIERIFDPYFTTREVGQGSGLGLSVAYGIVRSHGGYILVSSEPGKGSAFSIYLPGAPDEPAETAS